nr:hypothetical protein [Herbaspirillum sp. ASV7]
MNTIVLKKLSITAVLALAAASAFAAEQAPSAPATASATSSTTTITASADKPGLTRAQVLEDLKRYQREHANPSYAELVFLR